MNIVYLPFLTFWILEVIASKYELLREKKLVPGVLLTTRRNVQLFAVDSDTCIVTVKECWVYATYTTVVGIHKTSSWANGEWVKETPIDNSRSYGNFDPAVGAALAKRLIGKKLPYNDNNCNDYTYRKFFFHGKAVWDSCAYWCAHGGLSQDCPLAVPLHGLTVDNVNHPDFTLYDVRDEPTRVSDLEDYPNYKKECRSYLESVPGDENVGSSPSMRGRKSSSLSSSSSRFNPLF